MRFSLPLIVVGLLVCSTGRAGDRTPAGDSAAADVRRVLGLELHGDSIERDKRLKSVLRQSSDFAPARWQSGYVRSRMKWVRFDELPSDPEVIEYQRLRTRSPNTVAGHLQLASWCAKHGLESQRRGHLLLVLGIQPNHAAARKALGHVRVGLDWMTKRQIQEYRKLAKEAASDRDRWLPKLRQIRKGLQSGKRGRVQAAKAQLSAVRDPAAIPAIESFLGYADASVASVVVEYFGNLREQRATMGLARLAILSRWGSVRKAAARMLKSRKFEHFVPQVLSVTSGLVRSRTRVNVDLLGSLHYQQFWGLETRNTRIVALGGYHHVRLPDRLEPQLGSGAGRVARAAAAKGIVDERFEDPSWLDFNRARRYRARMDAGQKAREISLRGQSATDDMNRIIEQRNTRVRELIAVLSGKDPGEDPRDLWRWWERYTEVHPLAKPYVVLRKEYLTTEPILLKYWYMLSCLAAGTPVWTDRGPVAIDKVRVGDCVLAKNVETGELAYKPVLKTTVRRARPLLKLDIGPRTINVTGGHPFWISGKGWMKARDVTDGMRMHDVTGTTAVRLTGTSKAEPTYNLVVADFHTYFVGEAKVLSHDVTPIEPTDALVPGLVSK